MFFSCDVVYFVYEILNVLKGKKKYYALNSMNLTCQNCVILISCVNAKTFKMSERNPDYI